MPVSIARQISENAAGPVQPASAAAGVAPSASSHAPRASTMTPKYTASARTR